MILEHLWGIGECVCLTFSRYNGGVHIPQDVSSECPVPPTSDALTASLRYLPSKSTVKRALLAVRRAMAAIGCTIFASALFFFSRLMAIVCHTIKETRRSSGGRGGGVEKGPK